VNFISVKDAMKKARENSRLGKACIQGWRKAPVVIDLKEEKKLRCVMQSGEKKSEESGEKKCKTERKHDKTWVNQGKRVTNKSRGKAN